MKYLLDTNAVVEILRDAHCKVAKKLAILSVEEVVISSVVYHELYFGAFNGLRTERSIEAIERIGLASIEFSREDARISGEIRALLKRQGIPIGPYDTMLAGQAKARDLIFVTHNIKEFRRVPDLLIEDWEG